MFLVAAGTVAWTWPNRESRFMARCRRVSLRRSPDTDPDRRAASLCWGWLGFGFASPLVLYNTVPGLDVLPYAVQLVLGSTLVALFLVCHALALWVRFVDTAPPALRPKALRGGSGSVGSRA
jgi:hypothetical protein